MIHEIIGNKRYNTFDNYLKARFGCKVAKVSLNCGFGCPNRDGTKGSGGCIYCSPSASGDFAGNPEMSVTEQFFDIKKGIDAKWHGAKYLPYFQAGTGTYAPVEKLRSLYYEALSLPDTVGISIATRPDCIPDDVLSLLAEISQKTYLTVELGLQSIHDETGRLINRCTDYAEFLEAYTRLTACGINVCVHLINGLPGETREMMLESVETVGRLRPHAVKLHMLHILKNTAAERMYREGKIKVFELSEYVELVCDELELLPYDTVIGRITGDGGRDTLVAPLWSVKKFDVMNGVDREMNRRGVFQGNKVE